MSTPTFLIRFQLDQIPADLPHPFVWHIPVTAPELLLHTPCDMRIRIATPRMPNITLQDPLQTISHRPHLRPNLPL